MKILLSLGLSLWNFFKNIRDNRYKLTIYCNSCNKVNINTHSAIRMHLVLENHSLSPLSVSQMYLIHDDKKYKFEHESRIVLIENYKSGCDATKRTHSSCSLPFQITALGAHGGYFYVNIDDIDLIDVTTNKELCIKLQTCRGTKTERIKFD